MKRYIAPKLNCVELRLEERIASNCTGSCSQWQVDTYPEMAHLIALASS